MGDELEGESPLRALIPGTANRMQGCPSRGGIRRKQEVKSRADEQEVDMRRSILGEWAIGHKARWNSEGYGVNPTVTWDESHRSYLGRPCFMFERITATDWYLEQGVSRGRST